MGAQLKTRVPKAINKTFMKNMLKDPLFASSAICYHKPVFMARADSIFNMDSIGRLTDIFIRRVLEPGMYWVIDHPIVTVAAVVLLVYWSVRGYRML